MSNLTDKLAVILADTYALYLKTQNYHWHVKGPQFRSLHELFETQYRELSEAVDQLAERIVIKGEQAPATFTAFEQLKTLKDGHSGANSNDMVTELADDHGVLLKDLNLAMSMAQDKNDEGTANLLADRIEAHEKARWMLGASRAEA